MPTLYRFDDRKGELLDEADVSTQSAPTGKDARLPRAHEDEGRTQGAEAAPREGPETADRLTGQLSRRQRLTTSADFQALFRKGKRIDRPALIVLWRETDEPTRVGFAVSRQLRNAVQRLAISPERPLTETQSGAPASDAALLPLREARRRAGDEFERGYLEGILAQSGGNVTQAAALAEVSRQMLQKLMKKHGIRGGE